MEYDKLIIREMLIMINNTLENKMGEYSSYGYPINQIKGDTETIDKYLKYLVDNKLVNGKKYNDGIHVDSISILGRSIINNR